MIKKIILLFYILVTIISCDKEVSVSPPDDEPAKAFLYITSSPSGAQIFKNGRYSGKRTPDTLKFLEFGEYEIELKMDYFRDSTFTFNIDEEKFETIDIDYSKNPLMRGSVSCISTPPGGKIYINDSLTTHLTNDTIKGLMPGIYKFRYSYPEHRDGETQITVRSNKIIRAPVMLQDTSIWVDYNHTNSSIGYDYLNCIVVDKNNVKWIGTEGVGLIKFDDKNFTVYSPPIFPIPSGLVTSIDIDDNNIKWIGTYGGIARFDDFSWQVFRQWNSPLPSDYVEDIKCEHGTGNMWIGSQGGMTKFNGYDTWEIFKYDSLHPEYPWSGKFCIEIDANNTKYFGLLNGGLYVYNDLNWKWFGVGFPPGGGVFPNDFITCSALEANGNIWLGHATLSWGTNTSIGGITNYDGSTWTQYLNLFSFEFLRNIYVDNNNVKWVGTSTGLYRFLTTNNIKMFSKSNSGIKSDDVTDIVMDKNGVMWFTTAGGGLIKYKGEIK
ncbi:MAG: PEGA domain-containing protein [bacterium]